MINRTDPVIKNPTLQSVTWDLLSLGIALNKGVLRDLSILSIVNFRAFALYSANAFRIIWSKLPSFRCGYRCRVVAN